MKSTPVRSRLRVNPCIGNRSNHRFGTDGICVHCLQARPTYYGGAVPCERESEDRDPYAEGFDSDSAINPYRSGSESSRLWALGRRDAGKLPMIALAAFLLLSLGSRARAYILQMDVGLHPISANISGPLPADFGYAATGGLVQSADATSVAGGAYFPDGTDHGWTVLPAIPAVDVAPSAWSFEVLAANPAVWQVDIAGSADPTAWNVVGEVTGGFDFLESLGNGASGDRYGLKGIPVDETGQAYVVTAVQQAPIGFPVFVPEPASLLVLAVSGALAAGWRAGRRRQRR